MSVKERGILDGRPLAEDETIRHLRRVLHGQCLTSSATRKCQTPEDIREVGELLDPSVGRPRRMLLPGGLRRHYVRKRMPWLQNVYYVQCPFPQLLLPSLQSVMFESFWVVADGLFVGNRDSSEDWTFFRENKVTRVINCCGNALDNYWEFQGIEYLTYTWLDTYSQVILDDDDVVANEIFDFIEEAIDSGGGVLVQSFRGQSRSCCVLAAYLMRKCRWGLRKTLDFLSFKCRALRPNPGFYHQLMAYEERLETESGETHSRNWDEVEVCDSRFDELVLHNTYMNHRRLAKPDMQVNGLERPKTGQKMFFASKVAMVKPYEVGSVLESFQSDEESEIGRPSSATSAPTKSCLKSGKQKRPISEADGSGAEPLIKIFRSSGPVTCRADEIEPKRFGVQLYSNTIILEYVVPRLGLRAHHAMMVDVEGPIARSLCKDPDACNAALAEELRDRHEPWLQQTDHEQLTSLVGRVRAASGREQQRRAAAERRAAPARAPGRSPR